MCRSICALVLVLATCTIHAAPAPEPFRKGWDKPVDPSRDCKFVFKGGTVTIEVPGVDHDLAPKRKQFNAPRILRDFEGDFLMQVRVNGSFTPSNKSSVEEEDPAVAAGLVVIPSKKNCIRLEYEARRRKGNLSRFPEYRMQGEKIYNMHMGWDTPWKQDNLAANRERIYLRLERRGYYIYEAISPDGKQWRYTFKVGVKDLPARLKVGIAAYSTSKNQFKPCFDQFKLLRGRNTKPGDKETPHLKGVLIFGIKR